MIRRPLVHARRSTRPKGAGSLVASRASARFEGLADHDQVPPVATPSDPWSTFQRGDQVELADRLLARLVDESCTFLVGDEGQLFGYRPACGLWLPIPTQEQSTLVQTFAGATVRERRDPLRISAFDVRGATELAYARLAKPGYFAAAPAGFAFANGFVSVSETGAQLVPHAPDHRARLGFPFDYVRDSTTPMFLRLLDDLFCNDPDRVDKISLVQEHAGASLIGIATDYQRCLVWLGSGDEGKSTLAKILSACFPPGTVEAVSPQQFDQEYGRALLAGKLLNVVAELPKGNMASEAFKAIVAGDRITGRPIRQAPFTYRPRAGHLFLANRLPGASEQPHGFWRRFVVIRFNRCFTGDSARDPRIADKILAAERPGIVSWMLEGAVRLLTQNGYTLPASHNIELARWRRDPDPVAAFVGDHTSPAPEGRGTRASFLYRSYRTWAKEKGHGAVSSTKFGIRLRELGHASKKTRKGMIYPLAVKAADTPKEPDDEPARS
jgi:P4 family phage/plasmid primase-like protien